MNEKFYALPEEKQSQILNATYKVFAMNQYKKAPTSEIAQKQDYLEMINHWEIVYGKGTENDRKQL